MLPKLDPDPELFARELDSLANSLRDNPDLAATELGPQGLAAICQAVRLWATEYGVPAACIPEAPQPDAERTHAFLTDTAAVIRYFAGELAPLPTMKDAIVWLRLRDDPALDELVDLERALHETLRALLVLENSARALQAHAGAAAADRGGDQTAVELLVRASEIHEALGLLVETQLEICRVMQTWRLLPNPQDEPS